MLLASRPMLPDNGWLHDSFREFAVPTTLILALLLAQPPELAPEVARLDNGMQVVLLEDHTRPLISAQLWYRVGSADDDPNLPGLCHVVCTLLELRGDTAHPPPARMARVAAHTLRDACGFTSVIPARAELLDDALQAEAQRMANRPASPSEIARALACVTRDPRPRFRRQPR